MPRWSRDEIEEAFAAYREAGERAGATGDWSAWADLFTEDATYVEHHFGTMHGRESIRAWITDVMSKFPGNVMPTFPNDWYVIDPERGWVITQIQNRMADPGDGSLHQEYNWTLLKYAGGGLWSYEEDVYNPARFGDMAARWLERKRALGS